MIFGNGICLYIFSLTTKTNHYFPISAFAVGVSIRFSVEANTCCLFDRSLLDNKQKFHINYWIKYRQPEFRGRVEDVQ